MKGKRKMTNRPCFTPPPPHRENLLRWLGEGASLLGKVKSTVKVGLLEYCWTPLQVYPKRSDNCALFCQLCDPTAIPPLLRDRCSNTPGVALCFLWYRRLSLLHPASFCKSGLSQFKNRPWKGGVAEAACP